MNNIRGNQYSKRHQTLDSCPTCTEFWSFGFHESAIYDYPATIDYILEATNQEDLFFVGYSMATTQYLVLLSELPEYNKKIRAGFLLGPCAILANATNPLVKMANQAELIQSVAQILGMDEFMPNFLEIKSRLAHTICEASYLHSIVCRNLYALVVGTDPLGMDPMMVPTYLSQLPAGASTTTFVHFAQLFRNPNQFLKYDYGALKNLVQYGSSSPPEYALHEVTTTSVLYCGDSDGFVSLTDAKTLTDRLPNAEYKVVEKSGFSHLDFIFSVEAASLIYHDIIERMNNDIGKVYCDANCVWIQRKYNLTSKLTSR